MRHLRAIFCFVLAAFWLPATSHCALEQLGFIPADASICCDGDQGKSDGTSHHANACGADNCNVLEAGLFKASTDHAKAPPVSLVLCVEKLLAIASATSVIELPRRIDRADDEGRPRTWHFDVRAARSPRAPALA